MQDFSGLTFRYLVAVDAEGFSQRATAEQARVQGYMERVMTRAAAGAGLDRGHWYRQPCGDGELAVLPQRTDGLSLVAQFPRRLAAAVAAVNRNKSGLRLRLRVAIHHGAVVRGLFGPVGAAPVVVARLVDAEIGRQQLCRHGNLDIALIVSGTVYDEVIQSRLCRLNPGDFRRTAIRAKGISYTGYLYEGVSAPRARRVSVPRQAAGAESPHLSSVRA